MRTFIVGGTGAIGRALAAGVLFATLSPGRALKATFVPAMGAAYGCHLLTTNRAAPDPERVLPLYLIALATQFLHLTEEFGTEFYRRWPEEIFHAPPIANGQSFAPPGCRTHERTITTSSFSASAGT